MKIFWKGIATVFFYLISGALLLYAAIRSLNFVVSTLPAGDQLTGYLALAATSGGMIGWLLVFLYKADGLGQKITAALMVCVDMLGEFALFTFDTLYQTGQNGMTAAILPDEIKAIVLGLSGLIAVNIAATVIFHLVEPENIKAMRESFVRDNLENNALKLIEKQGDELSRRMAPALADAWAADFEARYSDLGALGLGKATRPAPALIVDAKSKDVTPSQPATPAPTRKARTVASLPRQLFKRPVRVTPASPQPLHAETSGPGELVNVAASDEKKSGAVLSVENWKASTRPNIAQGSGSAESDGHPNGQGGE